MGQGLARRVARRIERSIRTRGLLGSITHALAGLRSTNRDPARAATDGDDAGDDFDRRHGVDTGGIIPQADLDVVTANWVHGSAYVATSPIDFGDVLAPYGLDFGRTSFVDLGCGKGRVVLMAAALPFERVVGVEYSAQLSQVARANIARYRGPRTAAAVEVVTGDATAYVFPPGDLVVFMYHPFDDVVMRRVVASLEAAMAEAPRKLVVLYFKPVYAALWDSAAFVERRASSGLFNAYVGGVLRAAG